MRVSSSRGTTSSVSITLLSMKPVDDTTTHSTLLPGSGTNSIERSVTSPRAGTSTIETWSESSDNR